MKNNPSIGEVELDRCDQKFHDTFAGITFEDPNAIHIWREAWRVRTDDILSQLELRIHLARLNNEANQ